MENNTEVQQFTFMVFLYTCIVNAQMFIQKIARNMK